MIDHFAEIPQYICVNGNLAMVYAKLLGHFPGVEYIVWETFPGILPRDKSGRVGADMPLRVYGAHHGDDRARVQSSGQERADRYTAHKLATCGILDSLSCQRDKLFLRYVHFVGRIRHVPPFYLCSLPILEQKVVPWAKLFN